MEEGTVNHPLFSFFITLFTLILIYFPFQFLLSPVLLLSGALIVSLFRLGSTREPITRPGKIHGKSENVNLEEDPKESETKLIRDFVEWDLRAPLEVIHEAYEDDDEEEEEEEENPSVSLSGEKDPTRFSEMDRFPLLSLYYPESDSDSSSEFNFPVIGDKWISPEKMGLKWEEEDDGGLIEIKLDEYNRKIMNRRKWNQTEIDFHGEEEEGLIEIDIFS